MNIEFYQTIPDLEIKGRMNTPDEFSKIGLPRNLTDKTLLDIGCNSGAFMIEALKRGAYFVTGVEPDMQWRIVCSGVFEELKRKTRKHKFYSQHILYNSLDAIDGVYDVVLLLSVLHVTERPQLLLDKAISHTKKLLIVEINDRLQKEVIKLPDGAIRYGENKDGRSVWHIGKLP